MGSRWALLGLLFWGIVGLAAAEPPSVVLVFADDVSLVTLTDGQGRAVSAREGLKLAVGTTVRTGKGTTAELRLAPNGTQIKLAANTTFRINDLATAEDEHSHNDFALSFGKARVIAAKVAGASGDPLYTVKTPTANCGVRGTDFAVLVAPERGKEWLCVREGNVDFSLDATGQTLAVAAGEFADAAAPVFAVAPVDAARLAELFSDLQFAALPGR